MSERGPREGTGEPARHVKARRAARPVRLAGFVTSARYAARVGATEVHVDMPPDEWDAVASFPDSMAHLTRRLTTALGLDDPEDARWSLTYVRTARGKRS